jgi:NAD(P)-dependent dehydrogenase (short-subunit alcohol dehydrogenase family)
MTTQDTTTIQPTGRSEPGAHGERLKGRVAFVTGGTRGIGSAICRSLARESATIAAGFAGNERAANKFKEEFGAQYGTPLSLHQGNIGDSADCRRTIQEVIKTHGRLDILVNNAGITIDKTVLKLTDDDWYKVLNVNLSGAFFLSQEALRHMAERGTGRIVFVSSVIGEIGNIGQSNYAASKSGMFGLTKTMAREAAFLLAKAGKLTDPESIGLTVNTVTPGYIATEMLEHIPEKVMQKLLAQIPLGRLGKPDEIARVVHFLASDYSAYITGQVWGVNGGLDM